MSDLRLDLRDSGLELGDARLDAWGLAGSGD